MTIYAVVKIDNVPDKCACIVYSKQSSNLEKMKEYKTEIVKKYPSSKVALVTREKAKEIQKQYAVWFEKYDLARWEKAYKSAIKKSLQERGFL